MPAFNANKLTNMSNYCRENIENTAIRLPSRDQAAYYSLYSYFQRTIDKVKIIHQQIATKFPNKEKGRGYAKLTNEEIIQRGCYLHYVYDCLISLYDISLEWKITISETSRPEGAFKVFLNDLIFSSSDLTKISRFKRNNFAQNEFCLKINQALMNMLFQTEIYIYQILLRIFKLRLMRKEHKKMLDEIERVKEKYAFSSQLLKAKSTPSKRQQMASKTLLKEIQEIYTYYHCDISISREECNTKPELQCLVHLLKEKESESFLAMLKSGCKQLFNVPDAVIVYNEIPNQIQHQQKEVKQLQAKTEKQVNQELPVIETIPEKQEFNQPQQEVENEPQQVEESPDNLLVGTQQEKADKEEKEPEKEDEQVGKPEDCEEERQEERQEEKYEQQQEEEEEERIEQREDDNQRQEEVVSLEKQKPEINIQKNQSHQQQRKPKKTHPFKHAFNLTQWAFPNPEQKAKPSPKPPKSTSKSKTTFNTSSSRFINCSFRLYKFKQPSQRNKVKEKKRDDLKRYRVDNHRNSPFANYKKQRSDVAEDCLAEQTPIRNRAFVPQSPSKNP